jgi:hypothetical protein
MMIYGLISQENKMSKTETTEKVVAPELATAHEQFVALQGLVTSLAKDAESARKGRLAAAVRVRKALTELTVAVKQLRVLSVAASKAEHARRAQDRAERGVPPRTPPRRKTA